VTRGAAKRKPNRTKEKALLMVCYKLDNRTHEGILSSKSLVTAETRLASSCYSYEGRAGGVCPIRKTVLVEFAAIVRGL
jgi:hypothetical protein